MSFTPHTLQVSTLKDGTVHWIPRIARSVYYAIKKVNAC